MFGFGKGKGQSANGSDIRNLDDIKGLVKRLGESRAGEVIREFAREGNLVCQIFMSQAGIYLKQTGSDADTREETERFTKMAAENGHSQSQFNLAKIHMDKFDAKAKSIYEHQFNHIVNAKYWHREAAKNGYRPSIEALRNLEAFPDTWAEMLSGANPPAT